MRGFLWFSISICFVSGAALAQSRLEQDVQRGQAFLDVCTEAVDELWGRRNAAESPDHNFAYERAGDALHLGCRFKLIDLCNHSENDAVRCLGDMSARVRKETTEIVERLPSGIAGEETGSALRDAIYLGHLQEITQPPARPFVCPPGADGSEEACELYKEMERLYLAQRLMEFFVPDRQINGEN